MEVGTPGHLREGDNLVEESSKGGRARTRPQLVPVPEPIFACAFTPLQGTRCQVCEGQGWPAHPSPPDTLQSWTGAHSHPESSVRPLPRVGTQALSGKHKSRVKAVRQPRVGLWGHVSPSQSRTVLRCTSQIVGLPGFPRCYRFPTLSHVLTLSPAPRPVPHTCNALPARCQGTLPQQPTTDQPAVPGSEPSTNTHGPQTPASHPQTGPAGMRQTTAAGGPPGSGFLGSQARTCCSPPLQGSSEETLKTIRPERVSPCAGPDALMLPDVGPSGPQPEGQTTESHTGLGEWGMQKPWGLEALELQTRPGSHLWSLGGG